MTSRLVNIDIPFAERRLVISLLELDAPWTSAAPVERILAAIELLGLELALASSDLDETWMSYDRAAAAAAVWPGTKDRTAITLTSADGARRATVARYYRKPRGGPPVSQNTVKVSLLAEEVGTRGLGAIDALVEHLLAALPAFSFGRVSAANGISFPTLFDEPEPPYPFEQTAWLQIVGPRTSTSISPSRLLSGPVRVERRAGDTLWLWGYPDPMRYDTVEAIDSMRVLSRFLRATP